MDLNWIDVFLRGERNYVQGSQMLARTAELILDSEGRGFRLTQCAFKKTTMQCVSVVIDEPVPNDEKRRIGVALFENGAQKLEAILLEERTTAPRLNPEEIMDLKLIECGKPGCGQFSYTIPKSFEMLLTVIIQAIKQLHQRLAIDAQDIWFTGLRGAALPIDGDSVDARGEITIELMRALKSDHTYQTMNKVTLSSRVDARSFYVTFSLRSEKGIRVN